MKQSNISLLRLEPSDGKVLYNESENVYSFSVYASNAEAFDAWVEIDLTEEIQSIIDNPQNA